MLPEKDQKDTLMAMYQEFRSHARHHETQRQSVTNMLVVAVSALVGFAINSGQELDRQDWPLTVAIVVIGVFGLMFTVTHSARYKAEA